MKKYTTKLLSVLFTIAMLLSLLPVPAQAAGRDPVIEIPTTLAFTTKPQSGTVLKTESYAYTWAINKAADLIVLEIQETNRLTGATLLSDTHTFKPFLYEADGSLLLLDEAADGTLTLRIFSADLATVACVAAPAELADRWVLLVRTADHARNAVYFFTHEQGSWKIWRFDRETQTFADAPVEITLPMPAALLPMGASPGGRHSVILVTDYGSYFCDITEEGDFLLHQSLPGRVVWTDSGDGVLLVLLQDSEGEFRLQYYSVSEG